jgi:hypothetical protein
VHRLLFFGFAGLLLAANPAADSVAARMRESIDQLQARIAKDPTPKQQAVYLPLQLRSTTV